MKSCRTVGVLLAILCAAWSAGWAAERPVAIFTKLEGAVEVRAGSASWTAGRLMALLPEGVSVRLGKGARATLSYVRGGLRVYLAGPCAVTVGSQGVVPPSAAVRIARPTERPTALLPSGVNLDQMGGARETPRVALHVGGAMEPDVDVQWRTTERFAEYEVTLSTVAGRRLWKTVVGGTPTRVLSTSDVPTQVFALRLPENVQAGLQPATEYQLKLTASPAISAEGTTWTTRFHIVDRSVATKLAQARKEATAEFAAHPDDPTPMLLLADTLLAHDLRFSAYHLVEGLDLRHAAMRDLLHRLKDTLPLPVILPR